MLELVDEGDNNYSFYERLESGSRIMLASIRQTRVRRTGVIRLFFYVADAPVKPRLTPLAPPNLQNVWDEFLVLDVQA